jgi:nucleoside-diphosphate-sugar epimerase
MSTYLVTGASGFVGGALTRRLVAEGCDVRAVLRAGAQLPSGAERATVHVASLGDPNALAEAARGVDVLFHCAAENSARAVPSAYPWINVAGTENVLNAARHAGVRRVVHLSCSDATLVNRDRMSWRENQQLAESPLDALSRSKQLAEELALHASDSTLQVCVLRPAWVWGPGDRRSLPALCREAERGGVKLFGRGDNLVPSVYIDNLLDALLLAAHAAAAPGHSYHVLDGEVMNAREFITQLCQSLGLSAPKTSLYALAYAAAAWRELRGTPGYARADVVRRGRSALFDGLAAARELGYEPRVSVTQGMTQLAAWAKQMGGAQAIARSERTPANASDVSAFKQLADRDADAPGKPRAS